MILTDKNIKHGSDIYNCCWQNIGPLAKFRFLYYDMYGLLPFLKYLIIPTKVFEIGSTNSPAAGRE